MLEERWELLPALLGDMESGEWAIWEPPAPPGDEEAVPPPGWPPTPPAPPADDVMSEADSELRMREICFDWGATSEIGV